MDISAEDFREEMAERLAEWETCILDFELNVTDIDITNDLFRVVHTIKGVAGSCGYMDIMHLTHELESYLDDVRRGKLRPEKLFIDYLLQSEDLIRRMTADVPNAGKFKSEATMLIQSVQKLVETPSLHISDNVENHSDLFAPKVLRVETIDRLRSIVMKCLQTHTPFEIDLSNVHECDVTGVHFICSLVPVFVRSCIPLNVKGLSAEVVYKALTLGIDIRNVLKRASQGMLDTHQRVISQFTITFHPAPGVAPSRAMEDGVSAFKKFLAANGNYTENRNIVQNMKLDCTLLLSTVVSRRELEDELAKLPDDLLWTISLTPDQSQKNEAIRHLSIADSRKEMNIMVQEWEIHFGKLCREIERVGSEESKKSLATIVDIQETMRKMSTEIEDIPLSVCVQAIKVIRGEK